MSRRFLASSGLLAALLAVVLLAAAPVAGPAPCPGGENARVTERFTRVSADTLQYEVTFDDPATWTKPWIAMIPIKRNQDNVFEFACHGGNAGLHGILAGTRAQRSRLPKKPRKRARGRPLQPLEQNRDN